MIIDENKIKEYVNYHDWVNSPNEWHELWNTSVSVRGILPKNSAKICRIAKNERFTSVSPQ